MKLGTGKGREGGGGACEVGNREERADCLQLISGVYGGSLGQRNACTNNA